jgi:hypothetical protein
MDGNLRLSPDATVVHAGCGLYFRHAQIVIDFAVANTPANADFATLLFTRFSILQQTREVVWGEESVQILHESFLLQQSH